MEDFHWQFHPYSMKTTAFQSFSMKLIQSIEYEISQSDNTSYTLDECLVLMFQFLNSSNRERCS
ncbi:hypothetical protein ARALYDRAFT_905345 [Arabidopsis lyrata subsp. lyrata]|uniref:Uncharacterized protein n=1 Tax=Arabidopsis lyrata subsp. lyrata TaxID=81972 RepID=D7LP93_ARALL|nr:hypothetical protein ARALYDRAFT_905345 [Arabidopsis lyrata subsp. lyrata]